MASSFRSSFVGGMSLPSVSKFVEPRSSSKLHLRVVSESSTTIRGSEGNVLKSDGEVSRFIGTGIEKQGELWWASLFNVSAEEQWANLLNQEAKEQGMVQSVSRSPRMAPANTAAITLPDLIESQANDNRRSSSKVAFTAEKARALRKSLRGSETWHDGWYHSAIATRLAQPID